MNQRLNHLLQEWAMRDWKPEHEVFLDHAAVKYLGQKVYNDYEPSQFDQFENRLDRWLHNVTDDEDRLVLFTLLSRLFFIGRPEFESLCRAALHGPVISWLVDQLSIDIACPEAAIQINNGLERTWFCPLTDSMRINSFLKVNKLTGKAHRPDWRSLRKFGDSSKIESYFGPNKIDRIVLLEDFVGTGTQLGSAVEFAARMPSEIQILACPLVVCPAGDRKGLDLQAKFGNVSYKPVMRVSEGMLIKADVQPDEPQFYGQVRDLIKRISGRLGPTENDLESKRYHGFRGTGAVVTMYSNCPNNSLPILYDETETWKPLFPRIMRK